MSKAKVSTGLAAIMLISSLFVGWQTMLIVTILLFAFCEVDGKVKDIAIRVITFFIGLTLVITAWGLIVDGVELIFSSIDKIVATINSYLEYSNQIDIEKLQSYVINPASNILKIADNVVSYLFIFVKFGFIVSLISGKKQKDNVITNKIDGFVNKVLNFINSYEMPVQNTQMNNMSQVTNSQTGMTNNQVNQDTINNQNYNL